MYLARIISLVVGLTLLADVSHAMFGGPTRPYVGGDPGYEGFAKGRLIDTLYFQNCTISQTSRCQWSFNGQVWQVYFKGVHQVVERPGDRGPAFFREVYVNAQCEAPGRGTYPCSIHWYYDDGDCLLAINAPLGAQTSQSWKIERPIRWGFTY